MSVQKIKVTLESSSPALMHNGKLADPTSEFAKALKSIQTRNKTDDYYDRQSELEFKGGLYLDANGRPCWPADVLESCIKAGGSVRKNGKKVSAGLYVEEDYAELEYDGPKTVEGLLQDERFVFKCTARVGQAKILRTRPRFDHWKCSFTVCYFGDVINRSELVAAIEDAGQVKGLGDYRPKFGRFNVAEVQDVA